MRTGSRLLRLLAPNASARLRLTIAFTLLVTTVGAAIVISIYLVMTYVPTYRIRSAESDVPASEEPFARTGLGEGTTTRTSTDSVTFLSVSTETDILRTLLTTSLIVFAAVLLIGVFCSWIVAGRVLRPVEQITEAARRASSGSLDHRIELTGPNDEFRRLAETFDDMLERLDRSFEAQKRFAANASHELRTPLATTQAILDVALLDPSEVEVESFCTKLRETNSRNIAMVEALLALSDARAGTTAGERVELDDVAREVIDTARADAEARGIDVHSAVLGSSVTCDPALIRMLVGNLIANAIRYNVTGGDIWITVSGGRIRVENTGVPVADDDLARLSEPFFRSAGRIAGSHGLGLALVDAIATGHGAHLDISARDTGGLVVEVEFPR